MWCIIHHEFGMSYVLASAGLDVSDYMDPVFIKHIKITSRNCAESLHVVLLRLVLWASDETSYSDFQQQKDFSSALLSKC